MKKLLLKGIRFYQKTYIFHIGVLEKLFLTEKTCRFTPTCSQYSYQAIEKYGSLKGSFLGLKRISRCHPFSKGGYDPVQ